MAPFAAAVEASGLTKDELAAKVGVHVGTVYAWLGDRPRRVNAINRQKLSEVLGVPSDELWPPEPEIPDSPHGIVDYFEHQVDVPPDVWDSMIAPVEAEVLVHAGAGVLARESNSDMGTAWVGRSDLVVRVMLIDGSSPGAEALALSGFRGKTEGLAQRIDFAIDDWVDRLQGVESWEIRTAQLPLFTSFYRFDSRALVTTHLPGVRGHDAPTFLLADVPGGWMDRLTSGFRFAWDHPTTTVRHSSEEAER